MNRWLLDTSALLALRDDEDGAERIADMLAQTQRGEALCFGCFITLMELYYRVWKDEGELEAKQAYALCLALPIEWVHETPELLQAAARMKATQRLSLADAWIAAAAELKGATLVHKDPEFVAISLPQLALPFEPRTG